MHSPRRRKNWKRIRLEFRVYVKSEIRPIGFKERLYF